MNDKQAKIFYLCVGLVVLVVLIGLSNNKPKDSQSPSQQSQPSADTSTVSSVVALERDFRRQARYDQEVDAWKSGLRRLIAGSTNPYHQRALQLIDGGGLITQSEAVIAGKAFTFNQGVPMAPDQMAMIVLVDQTSLTAKRLGLSLVGQGKTPALYSLSERIIYLLRDDTDWFVKSIFFLHELIHLAEHQSGTSIAGARSPLWSMRSEEHAYRTTWNAIQFHTQNRYGKLILELVINNPSLNQEQDPSPAELKLLAELVGQTDMSNRMALLLHKQFIATGQVWMQGLGTHQTVKAIMEITRAPHVFEHANKDISFELLDKLIEGDRRWQSTPPDQEGAVALYEEVTRGDPAYAAPWRMLSIYYTTQFNDWVSASNGQDPRVHNPELIEKVTECTRNFLVLRPDQIYAWQLLVQSLVNQYKHGEALAIIQEARLRWPDKPELDTLERQVRAHKVATGN